MVTLLTPRRRFPSSFDGTLGRFWDMLSGTGEGVGSDGSRQQRRWRRDRSVRGDGPHYEEEEEHNENDDDDDDYDDDAMAVVSVYGGFRDELVPPASCEVEWEATVRTAGR